MIMYMHSVILFVSLYIFIDVTKLSAYLRFYIIYLCQISFIEAASTDCVVTEISLRQPPINFAKYVCVYFPCKE